MNTRQIIKHIARTILLTAFVGALVLSGIFGAWWIPLVSIPISFIFGVLGWLAA